MVENNYFQGIADLIEDIEVQVSTTNFEEFNEKFENVERYQHLIENVKDFQYSLLKASEEARAVIRMPLYIGVIGHYSHGKSSLLNALLLPQQSSPLLPTGESIVTSKCTLVQFNGNPNAHAHSFYERCSNSDKPLGEQEYQRKVSGKVALPDVNLFRICLATMCYRAASSPRWPICRLSFLTHLDLADHTGTIARL